MNSRQYYIRFRGMVTGPVDYQTLLRQVSLGRVTKLHELSTDGRNFKPASQVAPEIFDPSTPRPTPITNASPEIPANPQALQNNSNFPSLDESVQNELAAEYSAISLPRKISADTKYSARAGYILAAIVLFIDALLPTAAADGKARWLTAEFSHGSKPVALAGMAGLAAALCCIFFCCVSDRTKRGWLMLSLGATAGFFAGLCVATISMGWYVFIAASAIFVSAPAVAAALGAFAGRAHKPIGITACVYTIIAGLVTMIGLDQFAGGKFTASQNAAGILIAGGFLMMFISSCAAVMASRKTKKPFDPDATGPAPQEYEISIRVKNICVSAGFLTSSWAMLAVSTFFLLPVAGAEYPDTMTSLPLLRLAAGVICLAVIAGAGVFEIITSGQENTPIEINEQNNSQNKGCQHDDKDSRQTTAGQS